MNKKVIIIGAGGHAKVIADIVIKSGDQLLGFLDDEKFGLILNFPVLGRIYDSSKYSQTAEFIIAIGENKVRSQIVSSYSLRWYTAVHPTSQLGLDVHIGEGSVLMANSIINSSADIGRHCIINSGAIVEHDNIIDDFVHLSPSVTLGGTVKIGKFSHIGIGATVINNISICERVKIGAGGVVIRDILNEGIYVGIPVRQV